MTEPLPANANGRKRWTRTEVEFLENACLLKGHYELIDGEIVIKMAQNSPHAIAVIRVILYLARLFGDLRVRTQATMEVRDDDRVLNRPEPDIAVLRDVTLTGAPDGDNVLLAVEVSDTTQADDYGYKTGLYARAGVGEYWIVDLTRRVLVAYRRAENGEWQARQEFAEDAQVAPTSAPDAFVSISDLLPPLAA